MVADDMACNPRNPRPGKKKVFGALAFGKAYMYL